MNTNKVCPYRTETIVFHSDRKNYMLPSHGVNKLINYDVSKVVFKPCLGEECMFFDVILKNCNLNNSNTSNP